MMHNKHLTKWILLKTFDTRYILPPRLNEVRLGRKPVAS